MQYTRLGKSELTVSRICMGCMGFGDAQSGQHSWTLDEEHSREIIRYGLEKGIMRKENVCECESDYGCNR